MRECPKCGLFNPDESATCDCGFAFGTGTQFSGRPSVPKTIKAYITVVLGLATVRVYLVAATPPRRYSWEPTQSETQTQLIVAVLWAAVALVFALNLLARKNWARWALAIWSLPLGVLLLLSSSAKSYTSRAGESAEPVKLGLRQ